MSDHRRVLPKLLPQPSDESQASAAPVAGTPSSVSRPILPPYRKRRQPVSNACNNCKKRKTKCDGRRPRCAPCEKKGFECEFAFAQGVSPRQGTQQRIRNYKSVLELLQSGSRAESEETLRRIREAGNVDAAVDSLAEARLLLSAFTPAGEATQPADGPSGTHPEPSPFSHEGRRLKSSLDDPEFIFERQYMSYTHDQYVNHDVFVDLPNRKLPLSRWTTVSDDDEHMNHLLHMAYTWDNIVEHTMYPPIFEEDLAALDPDVADNYAGSFCSRFLVNALLAMSCIHTLNPITFKDQDDNKSRGRQWADEAERLLEDLTKPSMAMLQGIYALFIYEGNLGVGTKSVQYFMRAMEVYKALNEDVALQRPATVDPSRLERERQATAWCLWGFYCVEWRSTEAFGFRKQSAKPKLDKVWRNHDFPLRRPDCIGYWWSPYPLSLKQQPRMQVDIREADVALSELTEEVLDCIHPGEGGKDPLENPERALQLYDAVVRWKTTLPQCLRLEVAVLPSAIMLHVYVEVVLIAIIRPFARANKSILHRFTARDRCVLHANNLVLAIWMFRAFSQIRCEYYLNHPLGSAAFILLVGCENEPVQMDTLVRACQCLHEMTTLQPLATDVLSGIRAAFKRYNVRIPEYMARYFRTVHHRADGLLHHCVAGLLPSLSGDELSDARTEIQLQELLDEFGNLDVD